MRAIITSIERGCERALSQLEELEGPDADQARLTAWSGQQIERETLALECQSFLLVSKLALRQTEEAQALAEKMARRLEGSPPGYYLVAVNYRLYQAFCALGQSKRAERYLKRAYDDLLELYLGLKNAEFRKSFWRVRLHRQIRRARKGRTAFQR